MTTKTRFARHLTGRPRPIFSALTAPLLARAVALVALALAVLPSALSAHEPVFGLGPHTIFKGGYAIELEAGVARASGGGEREREAALSVEIIYGVTPDWAVTVVVPAVLDLEAVGGGPAMSATGPGDMGLRTKHRFWRRDTRGVQQSAAWVLGAEFPTGDDGTTPPLGSGSTDYLAGFAIAHESLRWYFFGDLRLGRPGRRVGGMRPGEVVFADVAVGLRPHRAEYLSRDLVVLLELNWEHQRRARIAGSAVAGTASERLFVSPGFFYTYRNWALKGGVQLPLREDLDGGSLAADWRASLAVELHL